MQPAPDYPRSFGKYVLLRPLATGGMAEVFLAQMRGHAGFDKACVVKRVLPNHVANAQFMEMFLDEAKVIARLSHPNVVQVFDMGKVDGDYFMAMEFVPGADLQNLLDALPDDARRLPLPVACRIIAQVAEGLDHAHRAVDGSGAPLGIVHRDVSPSNVIVSVDGVAKICDFGIAKFEAQASKTEVGSLKGKIHYMSPEQVRGDRLDARSDLFSLGVLLYEITVGVRPFEGTGPAAVALKILNEEPRPPSMLLDGYPAELWGVIQCLLAKRPADRFSSARELQVALDELLIAWAVRASSNEVAAYVEQVMPGIGERARQAAALAARPNDAAIELPVKSRRGSLMAVGPTAELRPFGAASADVSFGDNSAVPSPVSIELSGASMEGDLPAPRRSSLSGQSSRSTYGIVAIVFVVAASFYWLTRQADRRGAGEEGGAERPVTTAPLVPSPPPSASPSPTPSPSASPTPSPSASPTPSPSPSASPSPSPSPSASPSPALTPVVKPLPTPGHGPVVTPLPLPTPTPAPVVAKPHPRPKPVEDEPEPPRELPRLPTPPPAEGE